MLLHRLYILARLVQIGYRRNRQLAIIRLVPTYVVTFIIILFATQMLIRSVLQEEVSNMVIAIFAVTIGTAFCQAFGHWQIAISGSRLTNQALLDVDQELLDAVAGVPFADIGHPDIQNSLEVVRTNKSAIVNSPNIVADLLASLTLLFGTTALLAIIDLWLLLLPLATIGVTVITRYTQRHMNEVESAIAGVRRLSLHMYDRGITSSAAMELRTLAIERAFLDRHSEINKKIHRYVFRYTMKPIAIRIAGWMGFTLVVATSLTMVASPYSGNEISGGALFIVVMVLIQYALQVGNWIDIIARVSEALRVADIFANLIAWQNSQAESNNDLDCIQSGIALNNVSYKYPNTDELALKDVNVNLQAGTTIAIVGENGAGKTTLINIIAGLLLPTCGSIAIDGSKLSAMDINSWHHRISVVCQDYTNFEFRVRDIVGFGDIHRVGDLEAIQDAIDRAGASDFVSQLPASHDTYVGSQFGVVDLSGGQWQRLAVARGFMKREPLLLILDEPTGSLDAISEHSLLQKCIEECKILAEKDGTVVIFVSHRFSTVQLADHIIVLGNGRILEQGSHQELMAHGNMYWRLYTAQTNVYR